MPTITVSKYTGKHLRVTHVSQKGASLSNLRANQDHGPVARVVDAPSLPKEPGDDKQRAENHDWQPVLWFGLSSTAGRQPGRHSVDNDDA